MASLAERITRKGGAALVIDYGHADSAAGDTLQAVKNHQYMNPLENPGEADLTAHVDFKALGKAAAEAGAKMLGPVPQGVFLSELGLHQRAEVLARQANKAQKLELETAVKRLTASEEMGEFFKVMAVVPPSVSCLPGF